MRKGRKLNGRAAVGVTHELEKRRNVASNKSACSIPSPYGMPRLIDSCKLST